MSRRQELLEWMVEQPFAGVSASGLLEGVERLVVAEHRALFEGVRGLPWRPSDAYRFIRYESPEPVRALLDATRRLDALWAGERVGAQERVQLYGAAEGRELERLESIAAGLGRRA